MSEPEQLKQAQAAYDAQEPPPDWDCEEDGHDYRLLGESKDGLFTFWRCRRCGQEKGA